MPFYIKIYCNKYSIHLNVIQNAVQRGTVGNFIFTVWVVSYIMNVKLNKRDKLYTKEQALGSELTCGKTLMTSKKR